MALTTLTAGAFVAPAGEDNEMVEIKIIKKTVCGGVIVKSGQIVSASTTDARLLVAIGKAEPHIGEAKIPARKAVKTSTRGKK